MSFAAGPQGCFGLFCCTLRAIMPSVVPSACAISSLTSSSVLGGPEQEPCLRACGSPAPACIYAAAEPAVPPPLPAAAIGEDAAHEQPQALEQLLAAIESKDDQLVAAILRSSRPAVPHDTLYLFAGTSMGFSCPICRLLKGVAGHVSAERLGACLHDVVGQPHATFV